MPFIYLFMCSLSSTALNFDGLNGTIKSKAMMGVAGRHVGIGSGPAEGHEEQSQVGVSRCLGGGDVLAECLV